MRRGFLENSMEKSGVKVWRFNNSFYHSIIFYPVFLFLLLFIRHVFDLAAAGLMRDGKEKKGFLEWKFRQTSWLILFLWVMPPAPAPPVLVFHMDILLLFLVLATGKHARSLHPVSKQPEIPVKIQGVTHYCHPPPRGLTCAAVTGTRLFICSLPRSKLFFIVSGKIFRFMWVRARVSLSYLDTTIKLHSCEVILGLI